MKKLLLAPILAVSLMTANVFADEKTDAAIQAIKERDGCGEVEQLASGVMTWKHMGGDPAALTDLKEEFAYLNELSTIIAADAYQDMVRLGPGLARDRSTKAYGQKWKARCLALD